MNTRRLAAVAVASVVALLLGLPGRPAAAASASVGLSPDTGVATAHFVATLTVSDCPGGESVHFLWGGPAGAPLGAASMSSAPRGGCQAALAAVVPGSAAPGGYQVWAQDSATQAQASATFTVVAAPSPRPTPIPTLPPTPAPTRPADTPLPASTSPPTDSTPTTTASTTKKCAAPVAHPAESPAPTAYGFLNVPGISGGSVDAAHVGQIEITAFGPAALVPTALGHSGFPDATMISQPDKSASELMLATLKTTHFDCIDVEVTGLAGYAYVDYVFTDDVFSSFSIGGKSGSASTPTESLALNYSSVEWYAQPASGGAISGNVSWDGKTFNGASTTSVETTGGGAGGLGWGGALLGGLGLLLGAAGGFVFGKRALNAQPKPSSGTGPVVAWGSMNSR